jgi:hypothetical protein
VERRKGLKFLRTLVALKVAPILYVERRKGLEFLRTLITLKVRPFSW